MNEVMSNTQMSHDLSDYFRILRPYRLLRLHIPLDILVGSLALASLIENVNQYIFIVIGILITHSGAVVINDVFDLEVDRANRENHRPLVRGTISKNEAYMLFAFLNFIAIAIALFLVKIPAITFIAILSILLSIIYSVYPRTVDKGLIGVFTLSAVLDMTVIAIGIALFKEFMDLVVVSILGLLYILPNAIIKDFKDYEGDRECGKRTYVVDVGIGKATKIVGILLFILVIAMPLTVILYFHNYTAIISLIPFGLLGYYSIGDLRKLRNNYSSELAKEFQARTMLLMGINLVIISVSNVIQYFYLS